MRALRRGLAGRVTAVLLVAGIALDVAVGASPFPGYAAALGLLGCLTIALGSTWIGKTFLLRPEDHYTDDVPADPQEDLRG